MKKYIRPQLYFCPRFQIFVCNSFNPNEDFGIRCEVPTRLTPQPIEYFGFYENKSSFWVQRTPPAALLVLRWKDFLNWKISRFSSLLKCKISSDAKRGKSSLNTQKKLAKMNRLMFDIFHGINSALYFFHYSKNFEICCEHFSPENFRLSLVRKFWCDLKFRSKLLTIVPEIIWAIVIDPCHQVNF